MRVETLSENLVFSTIRIRTSGLETLTMIGGDEFSRAGSIRVDLPELRTALVASTTRLARVSCARRTRYT